MPSSAATSSPIVGTEKADIEVEVYETGTVEKLIANPGDKLPVGTPLAMIRVEGEAARAPAPQEVPAKPARRVRASPMARKLAQELGVDLEKIQGTGPGGVIERHDVEQAVERAARSCAELAAAERAAEPAAGMRHAIALAMARSNREIPHYYLSTQIDMTKALDGWNSSTSSAPSRIASCRPRSS